MEPLIPEALLSRSKKVLFLTHLAIGDFTYLQNCFKVFKEKYPHIKIDLWIDEVRRTRLFWDWKHLRHYALTDWVSETGIFNKIYSGSYSWGRFHRQMRQAKEEEYPLIISLCTLRGDWYAKYARKMSPNGFIASVINKKYSGRGGFRKVDARLNIDINQSGMIPPADRGAVHISSIYQNWFDRLFNLPFTPDQRPPFVSIPNKWISYAKLRFTKWGINRKDVPEEKVVFINIFAKSACRCWPIDRLVKLINSLRQTDEFENAYFIINTEPRFYDMLRAFLSNFCLHRVFLFTANENFFQLPAIISLCDLVISVETSIIHLASALEIPVVALMRKKSPEWRPYYEKNSKIIIALTRKSWIEDISYQEVAEKMIEKERECC
jgi:ADP-heptose:LPS heptosyltransferase